MHCSGNLKPRFETKTDLKKLTEGERFYLLSVLISTDVLPIGRLEVSSTSGMAEGNGLLTILRNRPNVASFWEWLNGIEISYR